MDTSLRDVEIRDERIALREPFGIATGAQTVAHNVFVRVTLASGAIGWGEAAPFAAFNGETCETVRAGLERMRRELVGYDARAWRGLREWLRDRAGASARCAVETAVIDALGRHVGMPAWVMFGGAGCVVETDMTITTGTVEAAGEAAARIAREGYRTIKVKVGGGDVKGDVERVRAIVRAAPECALVLDANAAMRSVGDAVELCESVRSAGGRVVLFEQPMAGNDYAAMRAATEALDVPVAADESVANVADVLRVAAERAADVVNLKVMKSGVVEVLEMAAVARAHGLGIMVGGLVETEMAMGMSASIAAGIGGVSFVDLDTPAWMVNAPVVSEMGRTGPRLDLGSVRAGHGARMH